MGWAAIITMILQVVGPYLMEWLTKLLEKILNKTATDLSSEGVTATSLANQSVAINAILSKSIAKLPRWAFGRRVLLTTVNGIFANRTNDTISNPLTEIEKSQLTSACDCVDFELNP